MSRKTEQNSWDDELIFWYFYQPNHYTVYQRNLFKNKCGLTLETDFMVYPFYNENNETNLLVNFNDSP